jgi:hypothetical protein
MRNVHKYDNEADLLDAYPCYRFKTDINRAIGWWENLPINLLPVLDAFVIGTRFYIRFRIYATEVDAANVARLLNCKYEKI